MGIGSFSLRAQDQKPEDYDQEIPGTSLNFKMVGIPAGEFTMGSPENEKGRQEDEGPQHTVKIDPFWMGRYEVTWDVYELFVYKNFEARKSESPISAEADAVTRPTKPYLDMTFGMGKEGHPAISMTQYNALQFCKWLYAKTGVFYRLPTEAEWEYACRAGAETSYSFGDDPAQLGEYAWFAANSDSKTHPVGSKKPNAWGLYDMHGNVMEWTMDQYLPEFYAEFKKNKAADNPLAAPTQLYPRTVRGGSFTDEAAELRSANRIPSQAAWKRIDPQVPKSNWWFPEAPFLGLRLVRPAVTPSKEEIEAYYNVEPIADL
ncbi:formylglycine-generating enzyme family protein [Anseongella ginsenosidimutans]|nr:formylglycine-generating enzyme family protein [Anseongella ginsenosidimutans]